MTMLKGYTVPSPGASDGEYGGFSGYSGCAGCDSRLGDFSASPAAVPYWEGQGIARTIPALNGYGEDALAPAYNPNTPRMTAPPPLQPVDLKKIAIGAAVGYFLGDKKISRALIGAGVAFYFRDSLPNFAGFKTSPMLTLGTAQNAVTAPPVAVDTSRASISANMRASLQVQPEVSVMPSLPQGYVQPTHTAVPIDPPVVSVYPTQNPMVDPTTGNLVVPPGTPMGVDSSSNTTMLVGLGIGALILAKVLL